MPDELVSICECRNFVEAQAIRASFEARGVFVHVDGWHYRGMFGMLGTVVALRIMVRSSQLRLARALAAEIIPDLFQPEDEDDEEDPIGGEYSPLRRPPAEDLVAYRDEDDENEEDGEEDEEDEQDDDEEDEEDEEEPADPVKKSLVIPLVMLGLGLSVGTIHLYAEHRSQGLALMFAAGFGFLAMVSGMRWGVGLVALVWLVDAGHGIYLLRRRNREIDQAKRRALTN